jgi:branched-chain amino acid transport system ATP-binding protein
MISLSQTESNAVDGNGTPTPVIALNGLCAGYAGNACVRDVNLEVRAGEVVALLGRNGAGKTTTILTMAGELTPISGQVLWKGQPDRLPLHRKARRGLALVTEERSVFMGLSAKENLLLGRGSEAEALALFPELAQHLDRSAGLLSGGQQQILTMARALAAAPEVLLADELSLGLAPLVVARLLGAVRQAADRGVGVLLVEQRARQALAAADRAYVMDRGSIILEGDANYLLAHFDEVERAYLSSS